MNKKPTGKQLIQRINADGEIYFQEEKNIVSFERFPNDKGFLMIAKNKKLILLRKPGFPKEMKAKDIGLLVELCGKYLTDRGLLIGDRFPIQKQQLPEILNLHRNNVHLFLTRVESFGVIKLAGDFIYVNPLYLTTSSYLPIELYQVFSNELESHLPEWVIKKYKLLTE